MNEPNNEDRERLNKIVQHHVSQLSEHFECVQILCSNYEQGGKNTFFTQAGSGNWFARMEHARYLLRCDDERDRCNIRKDSGEDVDGGGK